jgi:hypothetical protein
MKVPDSYSNRSQRMGPRAFAVTVYVAFFVLLVFFPILNEASEPISPFKVSGTDIPYYLVASRVWAEVTWPQFLAGLWQSYEVLGSVWADGGRVLADEPILYQMQYFKTGPMFPWLLRVTQYGDGATLVAAGLFLLTGIFSVLTWVRWLELNEVRTYAILVFCLLPAPLYFTIAIGTDLPFLALLGVIFLSYFRERWTLVSVSAWLIALVAMLLLRPNGLSIGAFLVLDLILRNRQRRWFWPLLGITSLLTLASIIFYVPHGISTVGDSIALEYFGIFARRDLGSVCFRNARAFVSHPLYAAGVCRASPGPLFDCGPTPLVRSGALRVAIHRSRPFRSFSRDDRCHCTHAPRCAPVCLGLCGKTARLAQHR